MDSNLRRRKGSNETLPQSVNNPKPDEKPTGHVASNRQEPTIAPTVFIVLIVGLMISLFPIFYYTQVMRPDPESTSILSQFRIKGNIILSEMGHASSSGHHHHHHHTSEAPAFLEKLVDQPQLVVGTNEKTRDRPESTDQGQQIIKPSSLSFKTENPESKQTPNERTSVGGTLSKDADDAPLRSIRSESKRDQLGDELSHEEQMKIDEELGIFWEASSRYRREAQRNKSGQYSIKGDGMSSSSDDDDDDESNSSTEQVLTSSSSLDDLPEADPDAQPGLTPEFWDAIKDQFSADDLTVLLNEMRSKEQTTPTHSATTTTPV